MPRKKAKTSAKKRLDIISIGDATLDHYMQLSDATVDCMHGPSKGVCMLCVRFADKIAVEGLKKSTGGNATNHAVGLSRLGLGAGIFTILGDDDTGKRIAEMLRDEKVSTAYVHHAKGKETNFSVVLNHATERTILVYHVRRDYHLPRLQPSGWIYYTSAGPGHEVMNAPLLEHVRKHGIKLAYNPGTYQLKSSKKELAKIVAATELLFVNKQEAQKLAGNFNSFRRLLDELHGMGAKIPIITDGAKGAYAFDGTHHYHIATTKTKVIERTGAGDAFAAGFVAARMLRQDVPTALRWGTMNSASVIQYVGPQAGLLTRAQMKKWLEKYRTLRAEPL